MEGHMFHYNGGHNWAWYSFKHTFKSYSDVTKDKNIYISQQTLDIALDMSRQQHGTLKLQRTMTTEIFMATQ